MTTNFELAASFVPTLPLSLLAEATAVSLARLPEVLRAPSQKPRTATRLDLVASLRRRIANGTYHVSAMQLADCLLGSILAA